ncbi:LysR family transcriptional regulator [Castellaniella sp.]|uniref:LysR family transcriptional regulator n=1 Tax=Castellaniella sp. TaxID=1955812 RepID=UPI002B001583|nr:LysR family transcriptional regulator [Castellaniella sp.]
MDWENLRYFAALANTGSLSGAARLIGVEHATVARRVARLERETGLKLVDRRGRRFLLTAEGGKMAAIARTMQEQAGAVERLKAGRSSALSAEVVISAPPAYAAARLAGPLAGLRERHPGIRVRVIGEKRQASLDRREADLAIRLSRPTVGDLTVFKIGEARFRLYASPAYLAATPAGAWAFVAYDEAMDAAPQQASLLAQLAGRAIGLRASTLEMQAAFILAGGGVGMLPDFAAEGLDGLAEADPAAPPLVREIWLVVHTDMKHAPAIRAVMDCLGRSTHPS